LIVKNHQALRRSFRRAALLGGGTALLLGAAIGLVAWVAATITGDLVDLLKTSPIAAALAVVPMFGLGTGLAIWLRYGGFAVIAHLALQFVLWRSGAMPLDYVRFLDYAAERIFLRKVGGGYIFVHRLLQDYLAAITRS
jgi:hypothetical protein